MKRSNLLLDPTDVFPVYEFRPMPGEFSGEVLRYNNGDWVEDDGKTYDICFIGMAKKGRFKYPAALYFSHPYRPNIIYQWINCHWRSDEPRHPNGNPWHYALKDGKKTWGDSWLMDRHPNEAAGRAGMNKTCNAHGCASGIGIRLSGRDEHIVDGLVRRRDTQEILTIPTDVTCMYCGDRPPTQEEVNEE